MASIKFPSAPSLNQVFSSSGRNWKWNGARWVNHTVPLVIEQTQIASLSTDLAAKASAAEVATKASLTGTETLSNKTLAAPVLNKAQIGAAAVEKVTVVNGGLNLYGAAWSDISAVWYFNSSSGPWSTFNVTNSTGNLLSGLQVGQSVTQVALITQTGTGYLPTTFTVDGAAATVKWSGGSAPTASTNAIDSLALTLIKTGTSTFILLGSVTKYA